MTIFKHHNNKKESKKQQDTLNDTVKFLDKSYML